MAEEILNTRVDDTGVIDGTDATFMADVIEASMEMPVIVDFWAPWCGPCKQLGPLLEAEVKATGGKVRLVKIDIDKNPGVAGQLRVQSIPMVYAFYQGQPVDGFQGEQSASKLAAFVAKLCEGIEVGDADVADVAPQLEAAQTLLDDQNWDSALAMFSQILALVPENSAAMAGQLRAMLGLGLVEDVQEYMDALDDARLDDPLIKSIVAQLALLQGASGIDAGIIDDLRKKIAVDAKDFATRFVLGEALYASGEIWPAMEEFLAILSHDWDWNEGAARDKMLMLFDALGPTDPMTLKGRRRMSSVRFR